MVRTGFDGEDGEVGIKVQVAEDVGGERFGGGDVGEAGDVVDEVVSLGEAEMGEEGGDGLRGDGFEGYALTGDWWWW